VELGEVAEIKNPDCLAPVERRKKKLEREMDQFCDDHYLSDLMVGDEIPSLLQFKFDCSSLKKLTDKNLYQLKDLGNREFLLDKQWNKRVHYGLIDILFAYCYDWRVTEGSHCIETPWNISRLSATLSWFEVSLPQLEYLHVFNPCIIFYYFNDADFRYD
jgi:protein SHQ1